MYVGHWNSGPDPAVTSAERQQLSSWRSELYQVIAVTNIRRQVLSSDGARITAIVDQLCGMFSSTNAMHTRNGGE